MEFVKTWAGSGNILDVSVDAALTGAAVNIDMNLGIAAPAVIIDNGWTARTGDDIRVTDDSTWAHSVINHNKTGSGASIGLDYQETYNWSSSSFVVKATLDNADGIDTTVLQAVRGTGIRTAPVIDINDASTGSAAMIDIDLTGIYTGNIFDFATSAAATGNVINMNMDAAVAMTSIHIEWSWVRTQPFIELITDSTSSASLIDISVDGAITGTAAIDIDMNAGLAASAIYIDAGAWTRTANLIEIKDDGDGDVDAISIVAANTGSGSVVDLNVTGIRTGNIVDIAMSAAATWDVIAIDMDAAVASAFLTLDWGAGTRTVDLIDVTFDGDGDVGLLDCNVTNTGSGNIVDFDITGVHTGNLLDITYSSAASTGDAIKVAMGTNVAGSAINITSAWARSDDIVKVVDSSTSSASAFDIDLSGAFTTSYAFDLNASWAHTSGLMNLLSNSANTGARNLINIVNDNSAAVGTIPLNIQQDAVTDTNFKTIMTFWGFTLFVSDGTTAEWALTGTEGDVCLNGGTGQGQMAFCDDTGTNWTDM